MLEKDTLNAGKMLDRGALLVDIREWEEVETVAFDVEDVLHLPYSLFTDSFQEIPVHREVIVGCRSGSRSLEAVRFLKEQGFQKVYSLKGGINDWIYRNLPVSWDNEVPAEVLPLVEKK